MHNKDIFCITVSLISGVQLSKTRNFDVLPEGGFGFRMQFVPIPCIKRETLEKPVVIGSKTYFFGFDPQRLIQVAETAKRDLEEEIRSEMARLNTISRKLSSDWSEAAKTATQEARILESDVGMSSTSAEAPRNPSSSASTGDYANCSANTSSDRRETPRAVPRINGSKRKSSTALHCASGCSARHFQSQN